ncbi:MAG TPA: FG-GAP-like repeat-containing protein, partial [Polyangia bacterium]|nr:FG-GAP-like repeat-containing protein [Polyangia bacterium]
MLSQDVDPGVRDLPREEHAQHVLRDGRRSRRLRRARRLPRGPALLRRFERAADHGLSGFWARTRALQKRRGLRAGHRHVHHANLQFCARQARNHFDLWRQWLVHGAPVVKYGVGWAAVCLVVVACGARTPLDFGTLGPSGTDPNAVADASVSDASNTERDAGGSNPSKPGSGPLDAGSRDAGTRDAAPSDAGIRDDASSTDAGIQDAAVDDASSTDAGVTPILAPRPVAPLSTATATSQRPLFHWALANGTDGAEVEVYRDRAASNLVTTFSASGTSGMPGAPLTAGVYFWRLRGKVGDAIGAQTSAVWEVFVGARSAPVNASSGTILDLNGDGYADIAVGAANVNRLMGSVLIHVGGKLGPASAPTTITPPDDDGPFAEFGSAVASAGDVNGDGFADLIVGAPGGGASMGAAYVYSGGASGLAATPTTLNGTTAHGYFGWSVSSAGDVNGDGYADVIVAPDDSNGASFLYLGSANGVSTSPISLATPLGTSAASAGDLNADGFGDIVVGGNYANRDVGAAYVFFGSANGPNAPLTLGPTMGPYAFFGYSVASAGDVNADGYSDIVVGSPGRAPTAYVFLGSATGVAAVPIELPNQGGPTDRLSTPTSVEFSAAVSGAGDVNGDGYADVIVGCTATAAAYVFLGGAKGPSTTPITFQLPGASSFGSVVAGAG